MILNNKELAERLFEARAPKRLGIIPPPDREEFKKSAASVDLHLGRWFRTMKQSNLPILRIGRGDDAKASKEHFISFDQEFVLHPGKFALGITLEWLSVPGDLAGHVTGKSSLGRRGLIIETAAGVRPGFAGCLTLELANVGEIQIGLNPGMLICQVFFHQATSFGVSASSQFKGARKPGLGSLA